MKLIFACAAAAVGFFLCGSSAHAATELCPASMLRVIAMHAQPATGSDLGNDDTFAYQLTADSPRTVGGHIELYAARKAYLAAFSRVTLSAVTREMHDQAGRVVGRYVEYDSPPLHVRVAQPIKLEALWVHDARFDGAAAGVACPTMPYAYRKLAPTVYGPTTGGLGDSDMRASSPQAAAFAALEADVDTGACNSLLVDSTISRAVAPEYPALASEQITDPYITALVKVLLDKDGKPVEASTLVGSGSAAVDLAAQKAARQSTYVPAQFLCVPVPSYFLFRANFFGKAPGL